MSNKIDLLDKKQNPELGVHIDGKFDYSDPIRSKDGKCECGGSFEPEYGFCKYGLGSFNRCISCLAVYDFNEDLGY